MLEAIEPTQPLIRAEFSENIDDSTDALDENVLSLHRKKPVSLFNILQI